MSIPIRLNTIALAATILAGACSAQLHTAPPVDTGTLSGSVALLGTGGPAYPQGAEVTLYTSEWHIDHWYEEYSGTLEPVAGATRVFRFEFPLIEPGNYYVRACFAFGCAEYRQPGTGKLLSVRVDADGETFLHFGVEGSDERIVLNSSLSAMVVADSRHSRFRGNDG